MSHARYWFDVAAHHYYIGADRVVSVTEALKLTGQIDDRWFTPESRERGLRVHALAERLDGPTPMLSRAECDGVEGEVQAYREFLADCTPRWKHIEKPRWHFFQRYGGRPDRIAASLFGRPAVVEIKTGAPADWHRLQLAGYQGLVPTGARFVLYLKPTGRYTLKRLTVARDYHEWDQYLAEARQQLTGGTT